MHDGNSDKKAKGAKKGVIKRELRFEYYTKCLLNNKIVLKLQQRFKNKAPHVYTEEIEKILRSSNDIKKLQPFERLTLDPYGTSIEK